MRRILVRDMVVGSAYLVNGESLELIGYTPIIYARAGNEPSFELVFSDGQTLIKDWQESFVEFL